MRLGERGVCELPGIAPRALTRRAYEERCRVAHALVGAFVRMRLGERGVCELPGIAPRALTRRAYEETRLRRAPTKEK